MTDHDGPDSSDDDLNSPDEPRKKRRRCDDDSRMFQKLNDEVASIREMLSDMMSLTAETRLPIGFRRVLRDTFKCQICHVAPVRPPVIVTKCCKNILGCQECANTWYSGPEAILKTCPLCRAERGCNETMVLRGLSEFMENIRRAYENDGNLGEIPQRVVQEGSTEDHLE